MSQQMATLGICLTPCTLPGSDTPLFTLTDHQMELGVGIHGEAGVLKINVILFLLYCNICYFFNFTLLVSYLWLLVLFNAL